MSVVAQFEIKYTRFLDPKGKVTQELPAFAKDPHALLSMYKLMVLLRHFDTKAVNLQRTGKMGTYAGILGQEAVSVAIGAAMRENDVLAPAYREYGAYIQRGVKLRDILSYWGGDERGSDFNNPYDFPICVPISSQCLHAAGAAIAFKYRKEDRVAVTVCGDGGTSKGDFYEAMNLAGDWQLPVVFVVNNNQWAISVPRTAQTGAKTLAQKAIAAGFEGVQVDGNDVIAVRNAVQQALDKARNGGGPTLIEALTYRLCDHTTADDAKRYRDDDELKTAWQEEPIVRLRHYLEGQGILSKADDEKINDVAKQQVEAEVDAYLNMPKADPGSIFDYMYENMPESLLDQRIELLEKN